MRFEILGPLEVLRDGVRIPLGGVRRRAVLARLLLDARHVVTAERLVDAVWGERPPATARKTLQKYVFELRGVLAEPILRTTPGGYVLDVDDVDLDVRVFERMVEQSDFAGALALWRGEVLADLGDIGFAVAERTRLDELRLAAWQGRIEADLAAGRHPEAIARLAELCAVHPNREPLVRLHLLALYQSGRPADALEVYRQHRHRLAGELGVEPSTELQELHVAILRREPTLSGTATSPSFSSRRPRGVLPQTLSSFVGRNRELNQIEETLADNRLVTLSGPGGVGKTRLAVEAATRAQHRFAGGAWLVDLAEITTPDQVPSAVALALGIDLRHAPDALVAIEARLAHGDPCLIVLDNCEHLATACSDLLRRVLTRCPDVSVLATSRRPLGVDGEFVLPVGSLTADDSIRLFMDRGRLAASASYGVGSTEEVALVCRHLDGLPLAIELAASQLRVLHLGELAARMSDRLTFRGRGPQSSPRQGTLHAMVSWSYDLVPLLSQLVFARLGVFMGSLTIAGAEAVCADLPLATADVLAQVTTLVDHSLLLRAGDPLPESRFRQLETLRLFALDRLAESGSAESARRAHASYFGQLAEEAGRNIYGRDERVWQDRLEAEQPNLDAALTWAADHDWSMAVDLAVALWPYWDAGWGERGAVAYLDGLLTVADFSTDPERRAWALVVAADMAANQGDARRAVPWARQAVQAFGPGDARGRACALTALGAALGGEGALHEAVRISAEAVAATQRLGDDVLVARALNRQHFVATRRGDQALAEVLGRQELACWRKVGSARGEATALRHLAVTAYRFGDLDAASDLCQEALAIWRHVDDPAAVAHVHTTLGDIARELGQTSRASALYRAALVDLQTIGDRRCEASICKNLATILAAEDAGGQSATLFREGIALRHELGDEAGLAECLEGLAGNLRTLACHEESATLLGAAAAIRSGTESELSVAEQRVVEDLTAAGRSALGTERFTQSWLQGQRMGLEEVVRFALTEPVPATER
jgi:predicted ATPase/DNA-binding SARP family transcriptional activator